MLSIIFLAAALSAPPQAVNDIAEFVQDWKTSKEFTVLVAQAMPEDKYGYRPNDEEMRFGALIFHIAYSQALRFSEVSGKKMPFDPPSGALTKADIVKIVEQSFDFCIAQLPLLTPEQLSKSYKVDWYQRPQVTGRQMVLGMFTHTAHHRGQAEVYLRANGIKPPDYRF